MTLKLTIHGRLYTIWAVKGLVTKANTRLGITGWTLPHLYIHAEEHGWKVRKSRDHLKSTRKKRGLCLKCGKPTVTKTLCLNHAVYARNQFKDRKGWYRPYRCASRQAEIISEKD